MTGIEAAVVLGAVAGAPSLNMEVLSKVNDSGETISCVGQIGKEGMKETDKEIQEYYSCILRLFESYAGTLAGASH